MKISEQIWKKAERNQISREKNRLMKKGFIKPRYKLQPQLLIRCGNGWRPEIKYVN